MSLSISEARAKARGNNMVQAVDAQSPTTPGKLVLYAPDNATAALGSRSLSISEARAEARCNNMVQAVDAQSPTTPGKLVLYDGVPPDNATAALGSNGANQTVVEITLADTSFAAATVSNGVATSNIIGTPAGNVGAVTVPTTLTFFRFHNGAGDSLWQGSITGELGGGDLLLSTPNATAVGQTFTISNYQWSENTTDA